MRARGLLLAAAALAFLLLWRFLPRAPGRPDVLLITLDTVRADAVGPGTPALHSFLAEATHFVRARTPVPLTLPAHLTLLSGLEPRSHGVHENLVPPLPRDRGFPLLAEELGRAGYRTAAFVASPVLGARTGLDAGFETFEAPEPADFWSGAQGDLPAEERVKAPLAWLAARGREAPFFVWVHFFDPHVPYLAFDGDARRRPTREGDAPASLYGGEVRRADAAVERLLAAVDPGTIVVIASDHGEGLGEHGEATHGTLCHGATADAFLAVRAPRLARGASDTSPRSLADVAPAVRSLCGIAPSPGDGVSLLEARDGRVVVTESLRAYRTYGWAQVFAATDGRFVLAEAGPRLDLFDITLDPGELRPLVPEGHEAYEPLDRALAAYRQGASREPQGAYMTGSPYGHAVRPLAGYLPRAGNAALKDPGQGFRFVDAIAVAKVLIHRGKERRDARALEQAIGMLQGLAAEDPGNPAPHLYLCHAQGRLGWVRGLPELHRAAARSAKDAIDRGYRVAPLLYDLLYESIEAGAAGDLRAALAVALAEPIHPDANCAELAREMERRLIEAGDDEGVGMARRFLERCRAAGEFGQGGDLRVR
jgi:arylsulfatase A-like enzyme